MTKISLLLALNLAACASAPVRSPAVANLYDSGQTLNDEDVERLAQKLAKILAKYVVALEKPVLTYHYDQMKPNFPMQSMFDAKRWIYNKPGRFAGADIPAGIDVAVDPRVSADFGVGQPWLSVLELRPGTTWLNDYFIPTDADKAAITKVMTAYPFGDETHHRGNFYFIERFQIKWASMLKLETRIKEILAVSGVFYAYHTAEFLSCRNHQTAIAITDPKAFVLLAFYTDNWNFEARPLAASTVRLFNEASFERTNGLHMPKEVDQLAQLKPVDEATYAAWKSQFIFGCGASWRIEKVAL